LIAKIANFIGRDQLGDQDVNGKTA